MISRIGGKKLRHTDEGFCFLLRVVDRQRQSQAVLGTGDGSQMLFGGPGSQIGEKERHILGYERGL
jgi:hypothetical protein